MTVGRTRTSRAYAILAVIIFLIPLVMIPYFNDCYALPKAFLFWMFIPLAALSGAFRFDAELSAVYLWVLLYSVMTVFSIYPLLSFTGLYRYYFYGFLSVAGGSSLMCAVSALDGGKIRTLASVLMFSLALACLYGFLSFSGARMSSSFGNPNFFGGVLAAFIPFIVYFMSRDKKYSAVLVLFSVSLAMTFSRASWLGAAAGLLLALAALRDGKTAFAVLISLLLPALFCLILFPSFAHSASARFFSIFNTSETDIVSRMKGYAAAMSIFKSHPFFGRGPETFSVLFRSAVSPAFAAQTGELAHAGYTHSFPLQILTDFGIVGLGAYFLLIFVVLSKGLSSKSGFKKAAAASVAAHFTTNLFAFPTIAEVMVFWFSAGVVFAVPYQLKRDGRKIHILNYIIAATALLASLAIAVPEALYSKASRLREPEKVYGCMKLACSFLPADYHLMNAGKRCVLYYNSFHEPVWLDRADAFFKKAIKRNPLNALALNGAGFVARERYYSSGDKKYFEESRGFFGRAVLGDPLLKAAYLNLAVLYEKEGDFAKSVKIYDNALKIYPSDTLLLFNAGAMSADALEYRRALGYWKKLEKIDPNHKKLKRYIKRAEKLLKAGQKTR